MKIIIGSDHAGFDLKTVFKAHLSKNPENKIFDTGVFNKESADYPVIGHQVAQAIANSEYRRGILICGTGIGMSITANRHNGVRAALCHNIYTTRMSRLHNNANILVLGARAIGDGIALEMLDIFLETQFEGGRHKARLGQI